MQEIGFKVGAKAARLIGRENISDAAGALTELIKNAYDADADNVLVYFDIPFPNIDSGSELDERLDLLNEKDRIEIESFFEKDSTKIRELGSEEIDIIKNILFKYNYIYVIDNGDGMDENVLKTAWMNIGTKDKEVNIVSSRGRVKTGAKGIGRFAFDKLSKHTVVCTSMRDTNVYSWELDWDLFENAELIDDVKASLTISEESLRECMLRWIDDKTYLGADSNFEHGTIIKLNPTRESWYNRDFKRVNNSLNSINPLTTTDKFKVEVKNKWDSRFDFSTYDEKFDRNRYDYKVSGVYDKGKLHLLLDRNELDTSISLVNEIIENEKCDIDLDKEFWNKEEFQKNGYTRQEFSDIVLFEYDILEILDDYSKSEINSLGQFSFELFFLKSTNSTIPFIKKINATKRNSFMKNIHGVKIYRDDFKVRPYGDEDGMIDWLSLGTRQQKSPGAPTNKASWRVMPYQLVGDVAISRGKNPYLNDQANREGLESNRFYYLFHDILTFVVEKFEEDRQYPLKLYGDLTRKIKKEVVERHKQEVLANIVEHLDANKGKKEDEDAAKENNEDEDNTESNVENNEENENVEKTLTNDDVEEAISLVFKQDIDQKEINDILMSLSSSGVMVGTFAHEIQRVATNLETRNMHLRHSINRLFEKNPYSGKASLNPLPQIEKYETTDRLLSSWINVITNPVMKENMEKKNNNFSSILNRICQEWLPLLEEKKINLSFPTSEDAINFTISELDIYLIVNNFILNSASFFENWIGKREIRITLEEQNDNVILKMINNGPPLSSRYQNNPDQIFVAGVTSKTDKEKVEEKGTGLGLWILSEAVERNAGKRKVLDELLEGFGIQCIFDKNG